MEFQKETGQIWQENAQGKLIAEVLFPEEAPGVVNITHIFVDDSLRGQGVGGKLLSAAAEELRRTGQKAKLTCPYAVAWFPKHPDDQDILV